MQQSQQQLMLQVQRVEQTLDSFPKNKTIQTGVFFDNQMFDAWVLLEQLVKGAKQITLIDDYVDASILQLFHTHAPEANIDCFVKNAHQTKAMKEDFRKFAQQYPSAHCGLHSLELSHDRWLIIDDKL